MRRATGISLVVLSGMMCFAQALRGQNPQGTLDITARITPTGARPEPVRQFTLYVLTKSYADIAKEIDEGDVLPSRSAFIEGLKVSKELKEWLNAHETLDLTIPELDKMLKADDIIHVPEFLQAYQRSNGGGVTDGLPRPKYKDADKTDNPEKYEKEKLEYFTALKKFIEKNPGTMSGVEMELDAVNPQRKWALLQSTHRKRVQKMAPEIAQTKYLAAKVDTDLEGHASLRNLAPGKYWISSLNLDANAGDARVRWDVPIDIDAGQTVRIELTNLNAADTLAASTP
jgi:hypothetical protein